jgi:polysaccharide deacetylase family protein (PEP-CTERM system associated)
MSRAICSAEGCGTSNMNCLTIDVEEHFQVSAFDSAMRRSMWDRLESRVERNTERLLQLLAEGRTRATFFVLGWVAERYRELVRAIARAGHEVCSHGYAHEMITSQDPERFRSDVRRAKALLEDLVGDRVLGYRAPSFSITPKTVWALPILVEEGYAYDSSVVPIYHDRYGLPGANPAPHLRSTAAGALWEIPPSTTSLIGIPLPVGGGGYLRIYPFRLFRWLLARVESAGRPLVLFLHPWEIDPEQPRLNGPLVSRFRTYLNLHKTEERLTRLLHRYRFGPIREAIEPLRLLYPELQSEFTDQQVRKRVTVHDAVLARK